MNDEYNSVIGICMCLLYGTNTTKIRMLQKVGIRETYSVLEIPVCNVLYWYAHMLRLFICVCVCVLVKGNKISIIKTMMCC